MPASRYYCTVNVLNLDKTFEEQKLQYNHFHYDSLKKARAVAEFFEALPVHITCTIFSRVLSLGHAVGEVEMQQWMKSLTHKEYQQPTTPILGAIYINTNYSGWGDVFHQLDQLDAPQADSFDTYLV